MRRQLQRFGNKNLPFIGNKNRPFHSARTKIQREHVDIANCCPLLPPSVSVAVVINITSVIQKLIPTLMFIIGVIHKLIPTLMSEIINAIIYLLKSNSSISTSLSSDKTKTNNSKSKCLFCGGGGGGV